MKNLDARDAFNHQSPIVLEDLVAMFSERQLQGH